MEQARPVVGCTDFPGLMSEIDPRDIALGGGEVQENVTCVNQGMLIVRGGLKEVFFDEE